MNIDYKKIGSTIHYFRTQRGVSQEALAEAAEVSRVFISQIERGEKVARLDTMIAIANALSVTLNDFLYEYLTAVASTLIDLQLDILSDCTKEENEILLGTMKAHKQILRNYRITK